MPLTSKGSKILSAMEAKYGPKKGKSVFYASINSGRIKGVEGKADGGSVDRLPEHYADIGMPRIEDRRTHDESLRQAGIDLLKSRSKMRHARGMMDSQRTEAEVIDRLVPRGYATGGIMNSPYAGIFGNSGSANTPPVERPDCPEPRRHWRDERPRDYGQQQQSPLGGLPVDPITQALLQKYGAQLLPGLGFGQGQGQGMGMSPGMGHGQGQGMGLGGLDPLSGLSPKIQGFLPSLPGFAAGGTPDSPYSDMMPVNQPHAGYIPGSTGGRADKVPMGVRQKSYVIPADVVSGLGEGNSAAGAKKLSTIFSGAPYGAKAPKIKGRPLKSTKLIRQRFADGGMSDMEPPAEIAASSGEYVLGPEQVAQIGGGDIDHGHDVLDRFVEHVRKRTIKTLRKLPGPKSR